MALSGEQKNFIKKNVWQFSPAQIAAHLGLPEREIHDYLKKRWRPEKYQKYIARLTENTAVKKFSLKQFLLDNRIIIFFLFVAVAVTYANSLGNAFVSDDIPIIDKNSNIPNISYIYSSTFLGSFERALYWLAYKIGGASPILFRFPNLIFHFGCVFLVFLILSLISRKRIAIFAAFLFAVHPLLSESVTWISGGSYAKYSFFFLLSLALYILSNKSKRLFWASLVAFALSLSMSEKAVVLSPLFVFFELAYGNLKLKWQKVWPYLGLSTLFGLIYLSRAGERIEQLRTIHYLQPGMDSIFVKIPTSIASYLWLIIWPQKLTLYHTEMVFTRLEYAFTVLVFLLYIAAIIFFYYKKNRAISFWLIFFVVPLAPSLTPLRVAWAVAERYAYVGTLGIFVVVAWLFYRAASYEKLRNFVYVFFAILVIALSVRTIVRNRDWKSEETLWFATVKVSPSGPNIHNNLGAIYQQKGNLQKAIEEFRLAIAINPGYADAYHNLANTYQQAGMLQEAADSYKKAIEINPHLWQSHQNLAAIYYNQGWYDLSLQELQKALEINPNDPNLKQNVELIESSLVSTGPQNIIYGSGSENYLNLPPGQNFSSVPQP